MQRQGTVGTEVLLQFLRLETIATDIAWTHDAIDVGTIGGERVGGECLQTIIALLQIHQVPWHKP